MALHSCCVSSGFGLIALDGHAAAPLVALENTHCGEAGGIDPGYGLEALEQGLGELLRSGCVVPVPRRIDLEGDEVLRLDPEVHGGQIRERPDEEPSAEEEQQRHGDLGRHEGLAQASAAPQHARRFGLERRREIRARRRERRRQTEHDAGQHREAERKRQDPQIRHRRHDRGTAGIGEEAQDHRRAANRQRQSRQSSDDGERQTFDEKLLHEPGSRRAERQSRGDLALTPGRAGEQQIGDIRAGDHQHAAGNRHQYPERLRQLGAEVRVPLGGRVEHELIPQITLSRLGGRAGEPLRLHV